MPDFTIQPLMPAGAQALFELQAAYAEIFAGAAVMPAELYLSPVFHGGEDVFCAVQGDRLLAYAALYLQPVEDGPPDRANIAWVEIKADPGLADPQAVKDALGERIAARLRALTASLPPRPLRLTFEYGLYEAPAAGYALSRGFQYLESIFHMRCDLSAPLPNRPVPDGVTLRRWKMETEQEQRAYIAARNACFSETPLALVSWQYYMTSPQWAAGTLVAGFHGGDLLGAVNVYWIDAENQANPERPFGYTEDIFVLPSRRGQGLAGAQVSRFLQ